MDPLGFTKRNRPPDCSHRNIVGGPCIGGNLRSDYAGVDFKTDGFGDTNLPYNSNGNIAIGGDFLPLVRP